MSLLGFKSFLHHLACSPRVQMDGIVSLSLASFFTELLIYQTSSENTSNIGLMQAFSNCKFV